MSSHIGRTTAGQGATACITLHWRQCQIDGQGVLAVYGYKSGETGKWVGIMLGIIVVYRLLGWAVTAIRSS